MDSYCESFHNNLDIELKKIEINNAKNSFRHYLISINKTMPKIQAGIEAPIKNEHLQSIIHKMKHFWDFYGLNETFRSVFVNINVNMNSSNNN